MILIGIAITFLGGWVVRGMRERRRDGYDTWVWLTGG
jgi:hypothetical protein